MPQCAGGKAYSNAHFGAGSGPIFLVDVQCSSSSSQLLECYSKPILSHGCPHSADASVICEGMYKSFSLKKCNSIEYFFTQLHVQMVSCDWQGETLQMKAEWRSA